MKKTLTILFLASLCLLLLAGCEPAGGAAPVPDVGVAQRNLDAAVAAANQATAVAEQQRAEATRMVVVATQEAAAIATATAQQAELAAQATGESLSVRQTEQAMMINGTREALSLQATQTAAELMAQIEEELAADEINRVQLERIAQQNRIEQQRLMRYVFMAVAPVILFVLALALYKMATAWSENRRQAGKPVTVQHDNRSITIVPDAAGKFYTLPMSRFAPPPTHDTPLLPAPSQGQLLPLLQQEQAILIHGEKGSGKTTLLQHLMMTSENPLVLDPHAQRGGWPTGVPVIGGGRKFDSIAKVLEQIEGIMERRYEAGDSGVRRQEENAPITVFVDEYRALVKNIKGVSQSIQTLLTEARKVKIRIVLVSHSKNVTALGFEGEGDLREGFAFVHLKRVGNQRSAALDRGDGPVEVLTPGVFNPDQYRHVPHSRALEILEEEIEEGVWEEQNAPVLPPVNNLAPPPAPALSPQEMALQHGFESQQGGTVPADEVRRILELYEDQERSTGRVSRRKIEVAIQGSPGGSAHYRVRDVLVKFGKL